MSASQLVAQHSCGSSRCSAAASAWLEFGFGLGMGVGLKEQGRPGAQSASK